MNNGSLRIYTSQLTDDGTFVMDLSELATIQGVSEDFLGGYGALSFSLVAKNGSEEALLDQLFDSALGFHVVEAYGEVSWCGMVVEVDREWGWVRERVSLIDDARPFANAVRVEYDSGFTGYATNDTSITRYGRRELTVKESDMVSADAEQLRDGLLNAYAWPEPYAASVLRSPVGQLTLYVTCMGYYGTAAWQDSAVTVVGSVAISSVIEDLIDTDCPHLTKGRIDTVADTVTDDALRGDTAWARMVALVEMIDSGIYRLWVDAARRVHLEAVDVGAPAYRITREGVRERLAGPVLEPWRCKPGLYENAQRRVAHTMPGGRLASGRTMLVERVMRRDGQAVPDLRVSNSSDAHLLSER